MSHPRYTGKIDLTLKQDTAIKSYSIPCAVGRSGL